MSLLNRVARVGLLMVASALTVGALPAAAQDRLFIPGLGPGDDGYEIGAVGRFGDVVGVAGGLAEPLAGGGRFAVSQSVIYDLRTGASRPLPAGASAVEVDPARPRVFIVTPLATTPPTEGVAIFDVVSGLTAPIVTVPECPTGFGPSRRPAVRYGAGGERLFVERCAAGAGTASDVLVFDLAAGVAAGPIIAGALPVGSLVLPTPDGTRLFVGVPGAFGAASSLTAWDVDAGSVVASVAASAATMTWDDSRQWLITGTSALTSATGAVAAWTSDLLPLGGASVPGIGCNVRIAASPHTGRLYLTTGGSDYYTATGTSIAAFSGAAPTLVAQAALSGPVARTCRTPVVRTAPGAPRRLRASAAGNTVSIAWENVGGASSFVLEAGLAPGRTDLRIGLGVDPRVTFAGVPSGVYYVRVRGGNEFGGGRASDELRLVVP